MTTPYVPPPPKPIRQLQPLPPSDTPTPQPIPTLAPSGPLPALYEREESEDPDDCFKYRGVPPTVIKGRIPCPSCGAAERLKGYGIQFNPEARNAICPSVGSAVSSCNASCNFFSFARKRDGTDSQ
jgi:hypothetical protein